jgi:hypothetical protein
MCREARVPTELPVRKKAENPTAAPWIAGTLALIVLAGLTIRQPVPCEIAAVDDPAPQVPVRLVRIVTAHDAPMMSTSP